MNTVLILLLPPRPRSASPAEAVQEYDYLLSSDPGSHPLLASGRAPAAQLPRADSVLAVPAEADVSWQSLTLPRVGRAKLRAALVGALEEALLDEPELLHFALAPEARAGSMAWVAVTHRDWLAQQLARLEEEGQVFVDRVAPLSWPQAGQAWGHFSGDPARPEGLRLHWSEPQGAATLHLAGSLARDLFPEEQAHAARWSAEPGAVAAAEHWLGAPVAPLSATERVLQQALASPWDLRQFELAPRMRGSRRLRALLRTLQGPRWRPLRWGLAGLVAVQLLGMNLAAWQQQRQLRDKRAAIAQTLRSSHPQVRAVLDAPLQMARETELLRAAAGRAGPQDFETLLAAAAGAWPAGMAPAEAIGFEPGRLQILAPGWSEPQLQQFRSQLHSTGWQLESSGGGHLSLSRARSL